MVIIDISWSALQFAIDRRSLLAVVGPNYNWWAVQYGRFLPRDAMLSALHSVAVCLSVRLLVCMCACVSVTLRYCMKTAKRRITQIISHDRPRTLVSNGMFCSCRISTDKRIAQSLCHSRASCMQIPHSGCNFCWFKTLAYATLDKL